MPKLSPRAYASHLAELRIQLHAKMGIKALGPKNQGIVAEIFEHVATIESFTRIFESTRQ